jgi:tetratricopeptide (TPR) repeat protein
VGAGEWGEGAAMTTTLKIEDFDLPPETEDEVYASLLRALRRKQGFGLFFVQCTPAQGQDVMARLQEDLGGKRLAAVQVARETTTLYDEVEALWEREPFDVLFVQGLEQALYGYEDTKRLMGWTNEEVYSYSWRGVPPILNHLNQRRDKLRNHFPACFVFLVPVFVVDYFLQRAADFLDWRSGLFVFPRRLELIDKEIRQAIKERDGDEYETTPSATRRRKILELKELYFTSQDDAKKAQIAFELGLLFNAEKEYKNAISSWDKAIEFQPEYPIAWYKRGVALQDLMRDQEAIESYERAISYKPDFSGAWNNRGAVLSRLARYQEEIDSYSQAIAINRDWGNFNSAYYGLPTAYNNRGLARKDLSDYQGAISDYDQAIKLKPDYANAYHSRAYSLAILGEIQRAITDYQKAIDLYPSDDPWRQKAIDELKKLQ